MVSMNAGDVRFRSEPAVPRIVAPTAAVEAIADQLKSKVDIQGAAIDTRPNTFPPYFACSAVHGTAKIRKTRARLRHGAILSQSASPHIKRLGFTGTTRRGRLCSSSRGLRHLQKENYYPASRHLFP